MSPLTLLGAVGLTAIAAVAVLWPYQRGSAAALQRLADPLEDERRRALRHLRDLDEDRAGKLDEAGYRDARAEAEARAVAVLRALEAREGTGELAGSLREVRRPAPSGATRRPGGRLPGRRWPRRAVAALVGVVVVAGAAALLDGAVGDRGTGQLTTGQAATGDAPEVRARRRSRAWSGACVSTQATSPPTSPSPSATWTPGGSRKPRWSTWAR